MQREEMAGWLRLALTPGVGNTAARRLLAAFGLPAEIFERPLEALEQVVGSRRALALQIEPPELAELLPTTLDWLAQATEACGRWVITLADAGYPRALLNTEDPPLMLYVMGQLPASWPQAISVVGSRNPTPQGVANARTFARAFAQAGLTVVSGLAMGVDAAAHEGALEGAGPQQLPTIAVVGTGLDRVYPRQHLQLCHRIAGNGLIVSEYPLGTPPLAQNFPKRNRIIAALSEGCVVVEATLKSGSLITAKQAAEQGKDVFAIPGSIHSPQARGCHALLKEGAKLVETPQEVLEEMPRLAARSLCRDTVSQGPEPSESGVESGLLKAIGFDPVTLDSLVSRTGVAASELQAKLLELELDGELARLPGGLFQRVCAA
jgi:DNA processing protein